MSGETNIPAIHFERRRQLEKLRREIVRVIAELEKPLNCEADRVSLMALQQQLIAQLEAAIQ